MNSQRPISIKAVAEKLAAARNCEHPDLADEINAEPRLIEALLFIQHVSQPGNYAGGLSRFVADLIEASGDLIGSHELLTAPAGRPLSPAEVREIYEVLPDRVKSGLGDESAELTGAMFFCEKDHKAEEDREKLLASLDRSTFEKSCNIAAQQSLIHYLRLLCEEPHIRFTRDKDCSNYATDCAPWYFPQIGKAVIRFIDRRKEKVARAIAETEITRLVFKWMDRARRMGWGVMLTGNSRRGKTQALQAWCAMHPGLARLVNTPASNSEGDLLREVAKALGLEIGANGGSSRLRDRIDYVLSHTRLMLVFDEAHMLFPVNFNRNTAPARLNWVRRSVMDAGLPCVFCATPQSYNTAQSRFLKATGYAIEQFTTRLKSVTLPEELSMEDLLAVARIHFPALDDDHLDVVVGSTFATERNYFSDLSSIAALAFCTAEDAGRALPNLADIEAAIADVLPSRQDLPPATRSRREAPAAAPAPARRAPAPAPQRPFSARARALPAACNGPEASDELAPSRITFDTETPEGQLSGGH